MSRSYKKHPILTDGSRRVTHQMKRIANHSVRRRDKKIISQCLYDAECFDSNALLDKNYYKKHFSSYAIHDWISRWSKAQAINDYYEDRYQLWQNEYKNINKFLNYWAKCYHRK